VSRETVRNQIVAYLGAAGIPNVGPNSVKTFPPKITDEGDFYLDATPGSGLGVIIFPYIERQSEKRIELTGATGGGKEITYEFVFTCIFRASTPKAEDGAAANEAFLDALTNAIRASKNCGGGGPIFQWGEGSVNGGTDLDVNCYYPKQLNASQITQVVSTVRVTVIEITAGSSYVS